MGLLPEYEFRRFCVAQTSRDTERNGFQARDV
jgi:hypothetical protein